MCINAENERTLISTLEPRLPVLIKPFFSRNSTCSKEITWISSLIVMGTPRIVNLCVFVHKKPIMSHGNPEMRNKIKLKQSLKYCFKIASHHLQLRINSLKTSERVNFISTVQGNLTSFFYLPLLLFTITD